MMTYTLIPGQPHAASEEETLSMIRSVLTEGTQPKPAQKPPSRKAARKVAPAQEQPAATDTQTRSRAARFPDLDRETAQPTKRKGAGLKIRAVQPIARSVSALRTFRPTTRHLALVSMLLLIVIRPHWFVIATVLVLATVIGAFMVLGADRIWQRVQMRLDGVAARDPGRAAELRTKLDRLAYRWDGFLDLFPDGMVDSLYMPDFQSMGQAEEEHTRAMSDRLARMGQEG